MAISSNNVGVRPGVCTSTTRPTAPYEGQMIYETDTDMVAIWNGTAWRYLAATTATTGTVLQVMRGTDTTDRNTTSTSFTDVTGISVTITPKATTSKIMVIATFTALVVNSSTGLNIGYYQITDSANTLISGGNGNVGTFNYTHSSGFFYQATTMIGFVSPNSVAAQTYKLRFAAQGGNTTVYVAGGTSVTQLFAIELAG